MKLKINPYYLIIFITIPFVIWGKLLILPTFDDWNTLSSPNYDPEWYKYLFSCGSFWRPFDAAFGYLYGYIGHQFYPTINHICIAIGHLTNTLLVYMMCRELRIKPLARSIATTFFYISPCVWATVWACDSLNQTYSQLWGMAAVLLYLRTKECNSKYILWFILVFIAAMAKENGLAWAVVPPIIAYGFNRIDKKTLKRHLLFGLSIAVAYAIVRLSIPHYFDYNPDYQTFSITRKVKEIGMVLVNSLMAVDLISILHAPSRNIGMAIATIVLSLPMFYMTFIRKLPVMMMRPALSLMASAVVVLSPHLLLSLSMMNAYASLGMVAVLVGYLVNSYRSTRLLNIAFSLYLLSALAIGIHTWYCSWKSGLMGKHLAEEIIQKTGKPVNNVLFIIVEDDYPKLSSFCVIPSDALGWGIAVSHANAYKWPENIKDTLVNHNTPPETIRRMTHDAFLKGYDCVWTINGTQTESIRKK